MAVRKNTLDWSHLQSALAVLRTGSLSAAARELGQSQPTIGRHVHALERKLGIELFTRTGSGLAPTDVGAELLAEAAGMAEAEARLRLAVEGRRDGLKGTVRITASAVVANFLLPEIIARARRELPQIQIELVSSDASENLLFREADIAIRMYRPSQLDVLARHVADVPTGLYAAPKYLDAHGRPSSLKAAMRMDFVGYDKSDLIIRAMRDMGLTVTREFFPVRCDDQAAHWQLVRAGCGIGAMQCAIGDRDSKVERILAHVELPKLPMWLAAPEALRTNPRIRAVWNLLAEALPAAVA